MKRDQIRLWQRVVILLRGLRLEVIGQLVWNSTIWKQHVTMIHIWETWMRGHEGLLRHEIVR